MLAPSRPSSAGRIRLWRVLARTSPIGQAARAGAVLEEHHGHHYTRAQPGPNLRHQTQPGTMPPLPNRWTVQTELARTRPPGFPRSPRDPLRHRNLLDRRRPRRPDLPAHLATDSRPELGSARPDPADQRSTPSHRRADENESPVRSDRKPVRPTRSDPDSSTATLLAQAGVAQASGLTPRG